MSEHSSIEWTDATWNPIRGCSKVSPGCLHCYAETFAERFRGVPGHPFEQGFDLRLVPEKLAEPFRWKNQRMIFVNSMSDLFHEKVPAEYIGEVISVMNDANWHTYQVLTKRADACESLLSTALFSLANGANIWWGVSVENRRHGLPHRPPQANTGGGSIYLHRTVARRPGHDQSSRCRLGNRRRGKRSWCKAIARIVGLVNS